jgi:hypothetical protein
MMMFTGFGLGNWLSVAITVICGATGYRYRVHRGVVF